MSRMTGYKRHDWLIGAVENRLCEEFEKLQVEKSMMRKAASQTLAEVKASDSWASTSATPAAFFGVC